MTIDSKAAPKTGRITGTLHRRDYVQPVPLREENQPTKRAEQSEVAVRDRNSGQEDDKNVH